MAIERQTVRMDVVVVGAGIAGLLAARQLQAAGLEVVVLERQEQPGGRMATEDIGTGRADTGAQFFSVRNERFAALAREWLDAGLIYEWSRGWVDASTEGSEPDGVPRYAVRGGMQALIERLADGLDVRTGLPVTAVGPAGDGWQVESSGPVFAARGLVLTPPAPESLALLDAGAAPLSPADRAALECIEYAPCIAAMFWYDGEANLPAPGGLQNPGERVGWMADNRMKGISQSTVLTVHATPEASRELWEQPDHEVIPALNVTVGRRVKSGARLIQVVIRRWPYALPETLHPAPTLVAEGLPPLAFAGDAFAGPRVEGAALSGMAAASALSGRLGG
ncbi:MAG TPA: FAD-dependent oxidoreductase [Aggregatilineales bacterium]|nr:FAD-dependent oxidoreductase [Aggregatilineales bacterium]HQA67675.1 FAD-dependent oxidoreductase [Aggregatilineales bacterium]HQE19907.1 FAD-dependent oxidoreductase [Aggregatilineales bacterium]